MTIHKGDNDFICRIYHCPDAPPMLRYLGVVVFGPDGLGCHAYGKTEDEVLGKSQRFWTRTLELETKRVAREEKITGRIWVKNEETGESVKIDGKLFSEYQERGFVKGRILPKRQEEEEEDDAGE